MNFNVNDYVRVRLTQVGRDHLARIKRPPPDEDESGWSRWQLWDLMHVFGARCFNGCSIPFETSIEIETQQQLPPSPL